MQNILPTRRAFAAFMIGWSCLYLLLVITTTQFHVSELTMLGLNIPFAERIAMTMADIMGGLPLIGIIFGVGYFLAMITASIAMTRSLPRSSMSPTVEPRLTPCFARSMRAI